MEVQVITGHRYGFGAITVVLAVYAGDCGKAEEAAEVFRRDGWRNPFGMRVDFDNIEVETHAVAS